AFRDAPIGDRRDTGTLENFAHRLRARVERRRVRDRFLDREVLEEAAVLHDGRNVAAGNGVVRRRAVDANGSPVPAGGAQEHVDRRGRPGTVGAEEGGDLTGVDLEGQVVDGGDGPEPLRQIAEVNSEHVVSLGVCLLAYDPRRRAVSGPGRSSQYSS